MFELFTNVFLIPLLITLTVNLMFVLGLFSRFSFRKQKKFEKETYEPVSVLISAKNEIDNLKEFLPLILNQDYPEFEVIVVDDQSDDGTYDFLTEYAKDEPKLKIVYLSEKIRDHAGKKLAISLGIRKSQFDILLLTDADCKPVSDQWIKVMARNYKQNTNIVLGHSPYMKQKTFLNYLIQFENFYTVLQYFSFALAGMPYMGVGRNLSYKKSLFYKSGFKSHLHVPYGDDDLFVNENADKSNTVIEFDGHSFMESIPPRTWKSWFRQKRRHLKGGREYKKEHRLWLGLLWFSGFSFYILLGINLIVEPLSIMAWSMYGVKFLFSTIVYIYALKKLKNIHLIWSTPIFDIIYHIFYIPFMSIMALFSKKEKGW